MLSSQYLLRSGILAAVFLFSSVIGFSQTIYVDASTGDDADDGSTPALAKLTIQGAIDAATGGETIIVSAGTYAETINIDESVTLQGPFAGTPGNDLSRGTGEAIIEQGAFGDAITINGVGDVTIDGFQIGSASTGQGIVSEDNTNITIQNNVIITHAVGVNMDNDTGVSSGSINIQDNVIDMVAIEIAVSPTNGSVGIALTNISGTANANITDNDVADASLGIALFGLTATPIVSVDGGSITGCTTGILITNLDDMAAGSASTVDIQNTVMSAFATDSDVGGTETGVYAFTSSAADMDDDLVVTMTNLDISGTGNDASNYAGIIIGDFFTGAPDTDDGIGITATITNCNIHDNENRGILTRGPNANTTITQSTIYDNGFDPTGAGGNNGYSVIARDTSTTVVTNCFIRNRSTQDGNETDGLHQSTSGSLTVTNSHLDDNGNGTIAATTGINLSSNYFGTTDESTISSLVGTGNDFTPWIPNGTDINTGTAGFQPDLDSLIVGSTGAQTGAGRIDEAIGLVDASGTVIVNAGTYNETVTVGQAVSLIGANNGTAGNAARVDETIIDPASASVGITINADNVTIDGFQLGTTSSSSNHSTAILNMSRSGFAASNNIIYSNGFGITVTGLSSGSALVSNNLVSMLNLVDPQNANTPSIGISVSSISGTADVDITNNDITNASYGIGGYALTSDNTDYVDGGNITGCTQGITITNADGTGNFNRSIASISNVIMSSFVDPGAGLAAPDAQAGIYTGTFTDGSTTTTADSVELTVTGVDISATGSTGTDYAAINVVDFAGLSPFIDDDGIGVNVTITDVNLHDNDNRGFTLRGVNATATITRSTIADNTNAAVVVSRLGHVTLTNNYLENPSTGTPTLLQTQTDATLTAMDNHMTYESGNLADGQDANDKLDLSRNYLGTTTEATITGLIDNSNTDYSPWITSGTDTNPSFAGFQPDLTSLHVGTSGDQAAGGIIQEGHDLVDTLGTVIVNGNSYSTDTLEVLKDFTLSPLVALTIQDLTTTSGSISVDNDLTVTSFLTLTNGIVDMDLDDGDKSDDPLLTFSGSIITGIPSATAHVEGKLAFQLASGAFDFLVGDEGDYRPVRVAWTSTATFEVAHVAAAPNNLASLQSLIGTGSPVIQSVLEDRYWTINTSDSPGSITVTLEVSDSDMEVEPGVLTMVRDNSGTWEEQGSTMESGSDPVEVTATATAYGDFSLISAFGMAPGNVSTGLQMWLKANAGTSTTTDNTDITLWSDLSGNGTDAGGTTNFPIFRDDPDFNFNFNPVILTESANSDSLATIIDPIADSDDFTMFMVSDNENLVTRGATGAGDGWSIRSFSSVTTTSGGVTTEAVSGLPTTSAPTIHTLSFDQGTRLDGYRNGTAGTPDLTVASDLRNSTDSLNIGIDDVSFQDGSIAELIMYNTVFAGTERGRIESYLAVKYGITLSSDYLAADGGTIWNTTTNTGYNNDVAGIGRDDFSSLDQRKSRTISSDSLVTIALGDLDSPSAFADNDHWLLWGNDDGATTFSTLIDNAHSGTSNRITRVWRVQETGSVSTVELAFNESASTETISLIVHPSDPTFANDANRQVYEMVYSTTTDDYRVTVDLTNGDYFTFAEGPVGGIPAVLISEVITDPQLDWSEDEFHNPNPGNADIGSEDEWVELYITQNNLDLSNWTIELIDGAPTTGSLEAGGAFTYSNYNSLTGGLFQATDSGDFIILGDPANVLANDVHVILRDENGDVIDQVIVENISRGTGFDGNADDAENESVTRIFTDTDTNNDSDDFVTTRATLGGTSTNTGIVLINEIVTDPQTDWGTNNFDGSDGGGAITAVDEWVELYIATDDLDLTNWVMDIENGANDIIQQDLSAGGAFSISNYFSETGGTFTKTDSGDYLVLGNAAENLINSPEFTLYDPSGNIIDQVALGGGAGEAPSGNASVFDDEVVARYPNATDTNTDNVDFIQTRPTLGSSNSPTGIVLINEVVTDPQQDWSTNGFDGTVSNGTVTPGSGGTDEWIELVILSDSVNLTNWTIELADGTDVSGDLTATGAFDVSNYFSNTAGSNFLTTSSGDYLVLGNTDGGSAQMSNDILITLRDATGNIVDQVELGDDPASDGNGDGAPDGGSNGGDASSSANESIARLPNATDTNNDINDFEATRATLGQANTSSPSSSIGNTLDFDGSDDEVDIGDVLLEAIGAVTVEAWIYTHAFSGPTATSDIRTVISKGNSEDDAGSFGMYFEGNGAASSNLVVALDNGTTKEELTFEVVATGIVLNTWHHIAVAWTSGSGFNVYLDGVLIGTSAVLTGSLANTSDALLFGNSTDTDEDHFDGLIDEVRIWVDERTQEEILENINTTVDIEDVDLYAYYRFDHSSGSDLTNLADNVFDGTLDAGMTDDDWVTADWPVYAENSTIVQSGGSDVTPATSGELSISDLDFLNDDNDLSLIGHDALDFTTVNTDLPSSSLLTNRYQRSWHLTLNDASANGGADTLVFDLSSEPNEQQTYYLLQRSSTSGDFTTVSVDGSTIANDSVLFIVQSDSLVDDTFLTLGHSDEGVGNALDLDDASSDYVELSNPSDFDFGTGDFTAEFWINVDDANSTQVIASDFDGVSSNNELTIWVDGNDVNAAIAAGTPDLTTTDDCIVNGQWHHIALVREGDDARLYVDGLLKVSASGLSARDVNTTQNMLLGRQASGGPFSFDGVIDEVRFWNTTRTQAAIISNLYQNVTSSDSDFDQLIAYYRFNEGIGNDKELLPDHSGNAVYGVLINFDNLATTGITSNYVTSDRSALSSGVTIINTTVDVLTNASEELTLTSTTSDFLRDEGDFITWGHDGDNFEEVTTDLPSSSNLSARISRTWQLTKGDVSDNDGTVVFSFDLGTTPDPDYTYYLLQRTGTSGDFDITEVIGSISNSNSITFTVDASEITSQNYFTLGRSDAGPGHGLDLDGSDDYISVSDNALLDITGALTLEAWVNLDANPPSANEGIISKFGSGGEFSYSLEVNTSGNVVFNISSDGTTRFTLTSASTLSLDEWTGISVIYDPSDSMAIYINGTLDAVTTSSVPASIYSGTADLWMGATTLINADSLIDATVDEIRIWSDVRNESEIISNLFQSLDVPNVSNLVAYYRFDDGLNGGSNSSVDALVDYSGNNLVGSLNGLALSGTSSNWIESDAPVADEDISAFLLEPGNALQFDRTNDEYVSITDDDVLDITSNLTIEAWVNLDALPSGSNAGVVAKYSGSGDQSYSLEINTSGQVVFAVSANGTNRAEVTGETVLSTGTWTHIAATYTPSTSMRILVNGMEDGELETGVPASIYVGTQDLWIGTTISNSGDNFISATIDEVRIWDTSKSDFDIQNQLFQTLNGDEANLAAYYQFNEIDADATTTLPDVAGTNDGTLTNMGTPSTNWISALDREPFRFISSGAWSTASLWKTNSVPNAANDVVIIHEDAEVSADFSTRLLFVRSGAELTIADGFTVEVADVLINHGTISGAGRIESSGASSWISGGTISNVLISGDETRINDDLTISGSLDLDDGFGASVLSILDHRLTVSEIIEFSSTNYIATENNLSSTGFVITELSLEDGDFTFPLASNGSYTPLTVTNLGSTGNIEARVFDNTYAQGTSGVIIDTEKEVNKSWEINGDAGVNVTVTLQWNATDEDPNYASARSTAYMSKNDYNWWEKITPDVGVTGSDPYQITASGIQTFSVFGTGTEDSSLPVTWMAFDAYENEDQQVELHWSTASELNNDRFEVEKSFDGRVFQVIGEITGSGTVNITSSYEFMDKEPFNGINYYRLRQVDYDGTDDYSEMVSVFVDIQREYNISLSPNPTTDVTTLKIDWENENSYAVGIFDMMGRNLGVLQSKFTELNLDLSTLPKGMYIIKIHTGDKIVTRKLVKH